MANARFTAYLSEAEREGLKRLAAESGTSENYILRIALRQLLDLPVNHIPVRPVAAPNNT